MKKYILILMLLMPFVSFGQVEEIPSSEPQISAVKARVLEVVSEQESGVVYDTGVAVMIQTVRAEILEGQFKGDVIELDQDYLGLEEGDGFILEEIITDGVPQYTLLDFNRLPGLSILVGLFVLIILVFARWQGLRSLASLAGSLFVIVYILVPLLLRGAPPILTSVLLATLILAIAIFFTHGFNKRSLIAFFGTTSAVFVTGVLAALVVNGTHLTGFGSHESTYLDFNTNGELDFVGLLLASIIIGVLGVLDDIAITQVAVVRELYSVDSKLTRSQVFTRAIRVGKEHVSALVNTLVLAYVGVALPLLLYVSTLGVQDTAMVINSEVFATEIVRMIIGSIGLILAVPFTTFLAAFFLEKTKGVGLKEDEKHGGCAHCHTH